MEETQGVGGEAEALQDVARRDVARQDVARQSVAVVVHVVMAMQPKAIVEEGQGWAGGSEM
jgi:hypothetical protein